MTKFQIFKYYLIPKNILHATLNGLFRLEMFLRPKKRREAEEFYKELEYNMYRYSVLDNCTCKKVMDKDDRYIESITEPDKRCIAHNDDWDDDEEEILTYTPIKDDPISIVS